MFASRNKSKSEKTLAHTLISRQTEIMGDLHFIGELIIEGKIKGSIYAQDSSEALVRIAENGVVEGDIFVPSVVVNGLVNGDIHSTQHVELAAKAVICGNVYYNLIEMVMGSEVNGSLLHLVKNHKDGRMLSVDKKMVSLESKALSLEKNTAETAVD
jgi:cytoskeletal protein CcmA (bactofilin family)